MLTEYTKELSQSLLLNIFEQSPASLIIKADAPYFTILAVSDKYLQVSLTKRKDIVGKGVFEVFPDSTTNPAGALSARKAFMQVIETKKSVDLPVYRYEIFVPDKNELQAFYWSNTNVPILGEDGEVAYILNTTTNITEQIEAEQKTAESERRFRHLVNQAPVAISILKGNDMIIETANKGILEIWGKADNILGLKLAQALPELEGQPFLKLLQEVYETGKPHYGYETMAVLNRKGIDEECYFNYVYHPLTEFDNTITGIMVVAIEVTPQVKIKLELEQRERQFRNLVIQAPIAMAILRGKDMVIEVFNKQLLQLWNKHSEEVEGRNLMDVLPELAGQPFPDILNHVYTTGISFQESEQEFYLHTDAGLKKLYISYAYDPLFEADGSVSGIMVTANNITEQVEARHMVEDAEERLRLAAEATGFGTWDLDLQTGEVIHSPRVAEIFGFKNDQVFTQAELRSVLHPDDHEKIVLKAFAKALKTGSYFYEARLLWPDGSIHWIRTQGKIIFDHQRKPLRMLGTILDVTSQRQIINELKQSEENLRLATSAAELGTFDWNIKEDKLKWDKRCRELFGIFSDMPVTYGSTFLNALHPEDRERTHAIVQVSLNYKNGGNYDVEYRTIGIEDKKVRWIRAKGKTYFNNQQEPVRLIGSVLDVTEIKQDEIRKNDFIAIASHELKTPLTSLKAYVQMLLANAKRDENLFYSNALQKANNQITKMTQLIYGFLDLSKIESGKLQLNPSNFDINELIHEVITDILPIAQSHQLIFEHGGSIPVLVDKEKISQVIINLINNAIKYSSKGSRVFVIATQTNSAVKVTVRDEGIGIKLQDREHIFQRFYRVEDEQTKGSSGFGIGLYLAAEIIQLHKGEIGVDSEEGKGSAFYFTLPLA